VGTAGYNASMNRRGLQPLAWLSLTLLALAGCGASNGDSGTRANDPTRNPSTTTLGPSADTPSQSRDMSGGGRGSMAPHEKGK